MDRTVAIFKNKKYEAYVSRIRKKIIKIKLFSQKKVDGFSERKPVYDKYLYVKEVTENEVSEVYREYFMARYKNYDFFVVNSDKIESEIQVITSDPNIGESCGFSWKDRDLFVKWLGKNEEYKLFHIKEHYLEDITIRDEVSLNMYFNICDEEFE